MLEGRQSGNKIALCIAVERPAHRAITGPAPVHAVEEEVEVGCSAPLAVAGLHKLRRRQVVLRHAARAASHDYDSHRRLQSRPLRRRRPEKGGGGGWESASTHIAHNAETPALDMRRDTYYKGI